jgi:hypothetical protein
VLNKNNFLDFNKKRFIMYIEKNKNKFIEKYKKDGEIYYGENKILFFRSNNDYRDNFWGYWNLSFICHEIFYKNKWR